MTIIVADRVLEFSNTEGTGPYTLNGAITGFRPVSSVCSNLDTFTYFAEDVDEFGRPLGNWETGLGTWASSNTLTRTTIYASSNSNNAVSWAAGTRRVGLSVLANTFTNINSAISTAAGTYTNAMTTPSTLGGISAGTVFNSKTWQQMMDSLLYPYQTPAFSSFAISGQTTPIEVGASIAANPVFTWATTNSSNISANTIQIVDVTNSNTVLVTGSANDNTQAVTLAAITKTSATSHTFRIYGTNTNTITFTRDLVISWQWKRFYGESASASLTEANIKALRVGGIASGFTGTYAFVGGGYKYLAYPTAFGTASSFKDISTNLNVPFEAATVVSVTNTNGQTTNYNVHRTTNALGSAISIIVA